MDLTDSRLRAMARQDATSVEQNAEFFARDKHGRDAAELDTYRNIREALTREVAGTKLLLDVGNGGVFEYDTTQVERIVAVDLFLDRLPASHFPPNVAARRGDALALDEPDDSYEMVLEALLYHHLVGARASDSIANIRRAVDEAERVLRPGGRLVVAESCVPPWFYGFEKAMFRPLSALARTRLLGGHPAVLQIPFALLRGLVGERLEIERAYRIEMGRWLTQFGRRWPAALTPARAVVVVARKAPRDAVA
jgi:SAM-dependent methyltransferase